MCKRHVDQLREEFPHVGAERERGSGVLMPSQAECLPGESGGTGSERRADAGCVEIVPGAAKFSQGGVQYWDVLPCHHKERQRSS